MQNPPEIYDFLTRKEQYFYFTYTSSKATPIPKHQKVSYFV